MHVCQVHVYWIMERVRGLRPLVPFDVKSNSPFVPRVNTRQFGRRIWQMIRSYLGLFSRHHFNWTFGIPKWEVSQRGPLLKRLGFFFFILIRIC